MRKGRTSNSYHIAQNRKIFPPLPQSSSNHKNQLHKNNSPPLYIHQNQINTNNSIYKNSQRQLNKYYDLCIKNTKNNIIQKNHNDRVDKRISQYVQQFQQNHKITAQNTQNRQNPQNTHKNRNSFKIRKRNISLMETKTKQAHKQQCQHNSRQIIHNNMIHQKNKQQINHKNYSNQNQCRSIKRVPLQKICINKLNQINIHNECPKNNNQSHQNNSISIRKINIYQQKNKQSCIVNDSKQNTSIKTNQIAKYQPKPLQIRKQFITKRNKNQKRKQHGDYAIKVADIQKEYNQVYIKESKDMKLNKKIQKRQKKQQKKYTYNLNIPTTQQIEIPQQELGPFQDKIEQQQETHQKFKQNTRNRSKHQILKYQPRKCSSSKKKSVKFRQQPQNRKITRGNSIEQTSEMNSRSKKKKKIDQCKTHKVLWGPISKKPFNAGVSSIFMKQNNKDPPLQSLKQLYCQIK